MQQPTDKKPPAKSKKQQEPEVTYAKHAVLYTDGGWMQKTNHAGAGVHGYIYSDKPAKQGTGCGSHRLTADGYLSKKNQPKEKLAKNPEVEVTSYIDGYFAFGAIANNVQAEIQGALYALDSLKSIAPDLKSVKILSDYQTLSDAANEYIARWKENNWVKSNGEPVKNRSYYEALDQTIADYRQKGVDVKLSWIKGEVKGPNGNPIQEHLGNAIADYRATQGCAVARKLYPSFATYATAPGMSSKCAMVTTQPKGYWKASLDLPDLVCQPFLYYRVQKAGWPDGVYYQGDHGDEDDKLGHPRGDSSFSVVLTKQTTQNEIKVVIDQHIANARELEVIFMLNMRRMRLPQVVRDLNAFGNDAIYVPADNMRGDLHYLDRHPISRQYWPRQRAEKAIEHMVSLHSILRGWRDGTATMLTETDITDVFFETKPDKTVKLRDTFTDQTRIMKQAVKHTCPVSRLTGHQDITLIAMVDIPERRIFKRIENKHPRVVVVTWPESPMAFRYAVIILTDDSDSIWAGVYANIRLHDALLNQSVESQS